MTDKERLEEIKVKVNNTIDTMLYVPYGDIKFLIEQAERVEESEEEVDRLNGALHYQLSQENIRNEENRKLKYKNKRYREALEFYANKINYLTFIENGKSNIEHDQGEKARKALEESK